MNALALVPKFQKELGIPKGKAIWKVIQLIFLALCCIAATWLTIRTFPYAAGFTEQVSLLPGDHIQVSMILDGEVLVDKTQFSQIAEGNTIFVSPGGAIIAYMTKAEGISYRYNDAVPLRYGYSVSSQQIQNGMIDREITRDMATMIILYIAVPLVILLILYILFLFVQSSDKRYVWIDW